MEILPDPHPAPTDRELACMTGRAVGPATVVRRLPGVLFAVALMGSVTACASGEGPGAGEATLDAIPGAAAAIGVGEVQASDPDSGGSPLRLVSYNIRHGRGMDGQVDLERTARVLRAQAPDLVALQEVDRRAERSGGVNQAAELGRLLDMTPAFEPFMEFQGGHYGMAILTRLPLHRSWPIELPAGREPRVALAAQVTLPGGDTIVAVNVHFDWVDDDRARFAQASALVHVLDTLSHPWVVIGDLNDEVGSRTLALFQTRATAATGSEEPHFTFSTDDPRKAIDFIFPGPPSCWEILEAGVVDERTASDHFPVFAWVRSSPRLCLLAGPESAP